MEYQLGRQILDFRTSPWHHHQEGGAKVELCHGDDPAGQIIRIACTVSGTASNHVQLWGPGVMAEHH